MIFHPSPGWEKHSHIHLSGSHGRRNVQMSFRPFPNGSDAKPGFPPITRVGKTLPHPPFGVPWASKSADEFPTLPKWIRRQTGFSTHHQGGETHISDHILAQNLQSGPFPGWAKAYENLRSERNPLMDQTPNRIFHPSPGWGNPHIRPHPSTKPSIRAISRVG